MNLDEEIARQLDEAQPVHINDQGELITSDRVVDTPSEPMDNQTQRGVTTLKPQRWYSWFNSNPRRLINEQEAMQARYPGFRLQKLSSGLAWIGWVKPNGTRTQYKLSIVYPDDFPFSPPKVVSVEPKVVAPKHQYGDRSLCLMYPGDGSWLTSTTAVQIVAMASAWLFCNEYHDKHCPTRCSTIPCRYWPGTEAPHR
jgi:ubiquitin-protein ligase